MSRHSAPDEGVAPDKTKTIPNERFILKLAVLIVASAALLLAGCSLDAEVTADTPTSTTSNTPTTSTSSAAPALRPVVENFISDMAATETGEIADYLPVIKRYATPECAVRLEGLYYPDGVSENHHMAGTEIVSVTENGTAGTAITRGPDGEDTQKWELHDDVWKLTCDGVLNRLGFDGH